MLRPGYTTGYELVSRAASSSPLEHGPGPGSFHSKPSCPLGRLANSHLDTRELSKRILRKLLKKMKKAFWLMIGPAQLQMLLEV